MPDGLAAFLTERLDEAGRNAGEIHTRDCQAMSPMVIWGSPSQGCGPCNCGQPERELRAIAAKREILRLHGPMSILPGHPMFNDAHLTTVPMRLCRSCEPETMWRRERSYPCRTLRQLGTEWNDHPAYQPEWSPEPATAP